PNFNVLVDILSPAPIANVLFIIGAVMLVRRPPGDAKSAARFLAAILLFSVVVWSLRVLVIWRSVGGTNDRERADLTIALFAIAPAMPSCGKSRRCSTAASGAPTWSAASAARSSSWW